MYIDAGPIYISKYTNKSKHLLGFAKSQNLLKL